MPLPQGGAARSSRPTTRSSFLIGVSVLAVLGVGFAFATQDKWKTGHLDIMGPVEHAVRMPQ